MKRYVFSEQEKRNFIEKYKSGKSMTDVAMEHPKLSKSLPWLARAKVKRILLAAEVKLRSPSEWTAIGHRKKFSYTPEQKRKLILKARIDRLSRELKMTNEELNGLQESQP